MAAKRILLLDGPFLTAYRWSGGHIKVEGEFNHEPSGLEAFAEYLKKYRSSLFLLLADVAEEGFQLEDIPYVQGADRTALLQRRLGQYYYNTPLSVAISLGRAKDGRRDEKLLFAALTRVETFSRWLDTLRDMEAILAGLYSVPLVLAGCAPKLLGENGPVLFVSLTRGGVRQSFFDQGKLHFSRLSQLVTHDLGEIGRTIAADAAKIFYYLVVQRQIPSGVALHTLVLTHADQISQLRDFCLNTDELQFSFMDIATIARQQGLKDAPVDGNADNLLIHCLAAKAPAQQFAPASERRFFKLWRIRAELAGAAWIVLAGCLLFAGKTAFNLRERGDMIEATRALMANDSRHYNTIHAGLPKISVTPDNLRALIGRVEALQKRAPALEPLLMHLSLALNDTPKIELTHLTWKIGDRPKASPKASEDVKRGAGAAPPAATATTAIWAVIEIRAQLPLGLVTDQRAQIELIESFAARLRDPITEVKVLSRPFDIESDKPLRSIGEKGEAQFADSANAPKFALRIARRL